MLEKINIARPLSSEEVSVITMEEYELYLKARVDNGIEGKDTLKNYHMAVQKKFLNELTGENDNQAFVVTCTRNEFNPLIGDYRHTLQNQGYNVRILHDPSGEATRKKTVVDQPQGNGADVDNTLAKRGKRQ